MYCIHVVKLQRKAWCENDEIQDSVCLLKRRKGAKIWVMCFFLKLCCMYMHVYLIIFNCMYKLYSLVCMIYFIKEKPIN